MPAVNQSGVHYRAAKDSDLCSDSVPTLFNLPRLGGVARAIEIRVRGRRPGDKVDAQRIAQYAYRFRDQIRLWEPPREVIQRLAFLSTTRQGLDQAGPPVRYNLFAVPVAEQEPFISKSLQKTLKGNVKKSLIALKEERKAVDQQIKELIQADARLKELFDLMISMPGVGPVIAAELLVATNELQSINDPKKLACHAGVAPFDRAACAVPFGQ